MLAGIPPISAAERDRAIAPIVDFTADQTLEKVVTRDINKMVETVSGDMRETIGRARPHRKVQPVKEAAKRIEKNEKSLKVQISEQIAREQI